MKAKVFMVWRYCDNMGSSVAYEANAFARTDHGYEEYEVELPEGFSVEETEYGDKIICKRGEPVGQSFNDSFAPHGENVPNKLFWYGDKVEVYNVVAEKVDEGWK